jgi:hypothetical protein
MGADGKSPYVEVACSLACATSGESTIRIISACDGKVVVPLSASHPSKRTKDRRSCRLLTRVVCCLTDLQIHGPFVIESRAIRRSAQ